MKRLAIIGSGISGLALARFLYRSHDITVFEADAHVGGHANTVEAKDRAGTSHPVDTGFMVFNHVTYPKLHRLFDLLGVPTQRTDMSFSVQHLGRNLEYSGSGLNGLFAQRSNLLRASHWRMLRQIDRFNREALAALEEPGVQDQTLGDYVHARGYGRDFLELYLTPMSSAVWSTPPEKMLQFPALSLLRFFHNHGFLGLNTQHPWWTVTGGSRNYVAKLITPFSSRIRLNTPVRAVRRGVGGIEVSTGHSRESFDRVIFACHPPATLSILAGDTRDAEKRLLSPFKYQANLATLHTDATLLPKRKLAQASWNYRIDGQGRVSTLYWMNRLQAIPGPDAFLVSINGATDMCEASVHRRIQYEHPLFDLEARRAQAELAGLNQAARGTTETYFAGAWQRYGFHEDGILSAHTLASQLLGGDPWSEI